MGQCIKIGVLVNGVGRIRVTARVHVSIDAANTVLKQGPVQCLLIDQIAASGIDEACCGFHFQFVGHP